MEALYSTQLPKSPWGSTSCQLTGKERKRGGWRRKAGMTCSEQNVSNFQTCKDGSRAKRISGDRTCKEPNIQQTLDRGLVTSAHGSLPCGPASESLVKTGKGSTASPEKLVSGTQILAANVRLQTWVCLMTFLSFSNRSHL